MQWDGEQVHGGSQQRQGRQRQSDRSQRRAAEHHQEGAETFFLTNRHAGCDREFSSCVVMTG